MSTESWVIHCCLIMDAASNCPFNKGPMMELLRRMQELPPTPTAIFPGFDEVCQAVADAVLQWRPFLVLKAAGALHYSSVSPTADRKGVFFRFAVHTTTQRYARHLVWLTWHHAIQHGMFVTAVEWRVPGDFLVSVEEAMMSGPPTGYVLTDDGKWDLDADCILLFHNDE